MKVFIKLQPSIYSVLFSLGTLCSTAIADDNSDQVILGGFIDSYFAQDFNNPFTTERSYTTQAIRDDEPRINIGMLDAKYTSEEFRGRLALQAGDSVRSNYAAEDKLFSRYVQESSVGAKIDDDTWIDAGIYPSHIGFETFNSRDNWNYTRSLVADYSPYYETGLKVTTQLEDNLSAQFNVVRGWQNISTASEPGYGLQLSWLPVKETQLVYANYLGEQNGGFRNFHDFIVRHDCTERLSLAVQTDVGSQGREGESTAFWHGWALLSHYSMTPNLSIGGRFEQYSDPHQVLLTTLSEKSFDASGASLNIDYQISPKFFWRTEYRVLVAGNAVFPDSAQGEFSSNDHLLVTSLSYSFDLPVIN